jgi:peptidoglycan hydrolase-like amidase
MAEEGADFRKILLHYYPNTTVIAMGGEPAER